MNHDASVINFAALKRIISALDGVRARKYSGQGRVKIDDAMGKHERKFEERRRIQPARRM